MSPILHVVPSVAPRYGGPSTAVVGMCRALSRCGVPVVVATTDADGPGRLDVQRGDTVAYDGVPTRFFPRQFSEGLKYSRPLGVWLRANVGAFAVVHVHAVFSYASIAAGAACRRADVPYVVRPLGTIDPWSLAHHAGRKRALMWLGARALLAGAARVHYTADEEQRRAERAMPWLPRGVVIPLGVDEDLFAPFTTDREQGPVVTVSRLDPKKGIDLLIAAFHRVSGGLPGRRLVIAGQGEAPYVARLQALAEDGPAADRIEFRGWVDAAARRQLLGEASVFALPSAQENFGIAIAEAMATGTPVVVTRTVDLAARIADRHAGWVTERSVDAVARALEESLTDPVERAARGERARELAEEYRWPLVASRLRHLYQDLSEGHVAVGSAEAHTSRVGSMVSD